MNITQIKTIKEYTIKIQTDREYTKTKKSLSFGKSLWSCEIDNGHNKTYFGGENSLQELFPRIGESLGIEMNDKIDILEILNIIEDLKNINKIEEEKGLIDRYDRLLYHEALNDVFKKLKEKIK